MANSQDNLYAPPTPDELSAPQEDDLYAPPKPHELPAIQAVNKVAQATQDLYAPPTPDELYAPPKQGEVESQQSPEYKDVRNTIDRSFFKSPIIGTEVTTDKEIEAIAKQRGVDPSALKEVAGYYGARREGTENVGEEALSSLTRGPLLGIPQFASKKLQDDPNMREAIDDVRELSNSKRSMVQALGENLIPIGGAIGAGAKGLGKKIAAGAATGATYGITGSNEGQEVRGGATGAVLGAGLGGVGAAIEAKLAARQKLSPIDQELAAKRSQSEQFNLDKGIQEISDRTQDSEKYLEDIVAQRKDTLSQPEVETILKEQYGPEYYERVMDPSTEEGQILRSKISPSEATQVTDQQLQHQMMDDLVEKRITSFAEDLTGKRVSDPEDALSAIKEFASRQGADATKERYKDFVSLEQAEKYIQEKGNLRAGDDPGFFSKAANFISDSQYVMRHIDDKYGTKLLEAHGNLNKDYNRSTYALDEFRNKYDKIFQTAQQNKTDDVVRNSDKLYKALDKGNSAGLTPQEKETATQFANFFEDIRKFVNGKVAENDPRIAPLSIPEMRNYVPHMPLQTADIVSAIEKKVEVIKANTGDIQSLDSKAFKEALNTDSNLRDVRNAINWLGDKNVKSGPELDNAIKEVLYTRNGNLAIETSARSAQERKGKIPEFLLETNLYKLARRYTDNTIRHLYLRNQMNKLGIEAAKLDKLGAQSDANYVRNLLQDINGVRKGTAAEAMLRTKIENARRIDKLIDKYGKDSTQGGALIAAKAMPDVLNAAARQIYPNLLGYFNLRAVVQNLTQPLTKTLPELGTAYGSYVLPRAAIYTVANMRRLIQKVESSGALPANFTRAGEAAIAEGIQRASIYQLGSKMLDGMGKAGMVMFQAAESFNRALTQGAAEMMAHDIATGNKLAESAVSRFPRYVQEFVVRNKQEPELVARVIANHLNDTTQFNYNRISMSEFGRTMGPFFSTFSKWPAVTAGDMIYNIRDKGFVQGGLRNSQKYLAPWVGLQILDYALGERLGEKEGLSDRQKKVMGANGLSQAAPIGTVGGFINGQFATPPVVDAFYKGIVEPAMSGKVTDLEPSEIPGKAAEVAGKTAATLAGSFFPGAGLARLVTDDIVTGVTGQRPEGSNFVERSWNGLKEITK